MNVTNFFVAVNSEQPDRLREFYREVVGLQPQPEMGPGAFQVGGGVFAIGPHSEVRGATKEPPRVLYDFFVDDLAAEQKRLEGKGVKFIRSAGREPWGGIISTFADPDGNYVQIIEYKPEH
jgi:predicted enzyme related to lactoylglutathione lyase